MTAEGKAGSVFQNLAIKLLNLIHKIINRDVDVPYLQKKYKATRGVVLEMHVTHTPKPTEPPVMEIRKFFKIENGKAVMMDDAEPDVVMWCELDTMLNMIKGKVERKYKGRRWKERYTPLDAWSEGRLTVTSQGKTEGGWLSDMELLSREIYSEVFPIIRREIGNRLP